MQKPAICHVGNTPARSSNSKALPVSSRYNAMAQTQAAPPNAALQHFHGTMTLLAGGECRWLRPVSLPIAALPGRLSVPVLQPIAALAATPIEPAQQPPDRMTAPKPREFFIQGITLNGRTFRPSDWSERLAGALSSFRPKGSGAVGGIGAHIGYSPYCVPRVIDNIKCVIVSEALRDLEPMAWDFVMHFARDNGLQVVEACLLPTAQDTPAD